MRESIQEVLNRQPLFSALPAGELAHLAEAVRLETLPAGRVLTEQGRTMLQCVYVVASGELEIYYQHQGEKALRGTLKRGDIYGAISILMNAGVSIRSVRTLTEASLLCLPRDAFLDLCTRHPDFYESFAELFRRRMRDKAYASVVATGKALHFISEVVPFSFLPAEDLERVAQAASLIHYPAGTVLFRQGRSRVEYLYVLHQGAAEIFFEENGREVLHGLIGEGDVYGGISMLLNDGLSIRTVRLVEDASFYVVPKAVFLDICRRHAAFSDFFTDTFGKRMLDRSYAEIVARNIAAREASSTQFFNLPVSSACSRQVVACDAQVPIQVAAAVMNEHGVSSVFVKSAAGDYLGVVTDTDLRRKVTATGYDILKPVADVMSSPLFTIAEDALLFEALMKMMGENIKHLAVVDDRRRVVGVITNRDLLKAQGQSPFFITREIAQAKLVNQLVEIRQQVPRLVQALIDTGLKTHNLTRFLTTVSDAVLQKIVEFALERLGPPPAPFVFLVLGSEGRMEQTLKTDQDNAILYADQPEADAPAAAEYFRAFGELVCDWLDEAGYAFCKGGVMAKNPKWCQPLSVWKRYFTEWIHAAEPENLLQASIFFDFRAGHGEQQLVAALRRHLFAELEGWPGFFRHMAENALFFTPPIGFFRNFVVESKGEHRDAFDIKAAMQPIVDYARIYALHHQVAETNTLQRLSQLQQRGEIPEQEFEELEAAYGYLMQQRFSRQVTALLEEKGEADNYVNPKKLSRIEQTTLKEIFRRIEKFQGKLAFDFTGRA